MCSGLFVITVKIQQFSTKMADKMSEAVTPAVFIIHRGTQNIFSPVSRIT